MTKTILLVRHGTHAEVGHVLSGRSEIALSEAGMAEVEALARALEGVAIASIHSSPRARARETAAPIAAQLGLEVRIAPALDEIDFGDFTGRSFDALTGDAAWEKWNAERGTARCPGGETMAEAVARARGYLEALPAALCPALCVSHCDVIRGVVAGALGLGYEAVLRFDCDPASRTSLVLGEGWSRVVAINERVRR
jgi:ribonuclease H / adenosylcobalamin/alpha-ribazole phosphatase